MALKVYVSYAWKAEEDSGVVAALETALAGQDVELVRDVRRVGYGESIRAFMDEIGEADQVVLVLSDAYFRSPPCLYELRAVAEHRDFRRRVHPIVLAGCALHDPLWWIDIVAHWEEQGRVLEAKLATIRRENIGPLNRTVDDYADFRRLVTGQMATLADMNALTEEVHRVTDFAALVARLSASSGQVVVPPRPDPKPEAAPQPVLQIPMPWWAERVERDARGVFIRVMWLGKEHRLDWDVLSKSWWASSKGPIGVDGYGMFCDADLGGVTQRFRRILPGNFWMGSREDEVGREGIEGPQHFVRLTEGYWLAETACSQLVWEAVMGSNPSQFKDDRQNPVERVSWDDVQGFLREVEKRLPGVKAALPTEAEWEYACRAGSNTAFSWGDGIAPDQANYGASESYANGPTGELRHETVPVRAYAPNAWGLYQMHGNILEWCADCPRGYDGSPQEDPCGADDVKTAASRAVRGGAWGGNPRWLRAASRDCCNHDERFNYLGFRLSLRSASH
ncbi:SUMF1/EgtB/PvdO family nonheme iron enzyme [Zoogloea sp.]|uniref:SUMF1/EgtB/PvdO family nonheme iron enzyme n=1 Tax=Zoogloea sp. TaxID=49181 RepID=UPI0035B115CE